METTDLEQRIGFPVFFNNPLAVHETKTTPFIFLQFVHILCGLQSYIFSSNTRLTSSGDKPGPLSQTDIST